MFLRKLLKNNPQLIETAYYFFKKGDLLPDTYIIDEDAAIENAKMILKEADKNNIRLYFMLKQLGHNPQLALDLQKAGYPGAVAVDFREALLYIEHGIRLGNVGHLVQVPHHALRRILAASPEIVTIYTLEKAAEINDVCISLGKKQPVMLRIRDEKDIVYPGQAAGFSLKELPDIAARISSMTNISIGGICSFPCFLYNDEKARIEDTPNMHTLMEARQILNELNFRNVNVNAPSICCMESIKQMPEFGVTHSEPGHGLSGTTPYHVDHDGAERCAYLYLSEISHNVDNKAYCYGGGNYPRGHIKGALTGYRFSEDSIVEIDPVSNGNIDYHFAIHGKQKVSDPVIMCFRAQMFTARSRIAVISGISSGKPKISGIYDSAGQKAGM